MNDSVEAGALYIVSTPIGNLDDITLRAINVLAAVDLIAAEDTRKTRFLLDHLNIAKPLLSYHSYNETRRSPLIVGKLSEGKSIALVTDAGTPGVSDPAFALVRDVLQSGFRVVPVPGASAALAALVVSGLPTERFVFEGFLPTKKGRKSKLDRLKSEPRTIILYESPFRIVKTVEEILSTFGDRRMAVARELTKKFEEVLRGSGSDVLQSLKAKPPRGEYVVVIEGSKEEG